uniref:Uncharacterized protein n=1 Tax=Zea mays TaxID=4577 RepID=C4J609_MAIZE|nr:unknown [Zea mays]
MAPASHRTWRPPRTSPSRCGPARRSRRLSPRWPAGAQRATTHTTTTPPTPPTPPPRAPPAAAAAPSVGDVLLQWGHKKRSSCRRDSATAAAPSAQRRQSAVGGGVKIQRRASAPAHAEKLMPPPPPAATRGSNLRSASSFPSRASASTAATGSHHPPHHHRTVEDRSGGQKRSSPDKTHRSTMDGVYHHHHHQESPLTGNGVATAGEKLGVERFELPLIYISLSRKEKEDDFLAMKGTKLPQRPKKRAKNVDKTLQFVFPGYVVVRFDEGTVRGAGEEMREEEAKRAERDGEHGQRLRSNKVEARRSHLPWGVGVEEEGALEKEERRRR